MAGDQNFKNHTRVYPLFHIWTFFPLLVNFIWSEHAAGYFARQLGAQCKDKVLAKVLGFISVDEFRHAEGGQRDAVDEGPIGPGPGHGNGGVRGLDLRLGAGALAGFRNGNARRRPSSGDRRRNDVLFPPGKDR